MDEEKIRRFVRECPPFRALLAAIVVAQYERSISEEVKPKLAGRNDIHWRDIFLTATSSFQNDHAQQTALRQNVRSRSCKHPFAGTRNSPDGPSALPPRDE